VIGLVVLYIFFSGEPGYSRIEGTPEISFLSTLCLSSSFAPPSTRSRSRPSGRQAATTMGSLTDRECPCPGRILTDTGSAFAIGAVGASFFHFVKGLRNAPTGARFTGGLEAVRMNAPRIGSNFAVWGGLYSVCDCTLVYVRQKEDPWNSILSGAATGGILSLRQGFRSVIRSSMHGAIFFALVNGAIITTQQSQPLSTPVDVPAVTPVEISSSEAITPVETFEKESGRGNHK